MVITTAQQYAYDAIDYTNDHKKDKSIVVGVAPGAGVAFCELCNMNV